MKRMLFNATQAEELRVAIVDGQKLIDLDIESSAKEQRKSNIYKGVITRVEPSLEAAFVDYGSERHGFLPFKEVARAYFKAGVDVGRARIQDALSEGQEVIVQVDKDERGNKGAALTTFISLAGRYLVLMPNNPRGGGVSRRVEGEDRNELREVIDSLDVPQGMSIIARTAAIGRNKEELGWDLSYLMQLWLAIEGAAGQQNGAFLIYQESSLVIRAIRDYFHQDIGEILIDTESIFEQAQQFMGHVMPGNVNRVKLYKDDVPLFSRFQIEHQIESAYSRGVTLPSGGAIVIDHTEALVSIDVNSARSTKGADIEETAFQTNCEAADEIARQLRLRDLGGLIVVDFIDMESTRNQREVENRFRDALRFDRARIQLGKISRFGLLELSRQRLRPSLGETSHSPCPRCHGTGHIRGTESTALHILRIVQEEAMKDNTAAVHAQVPVDVATFLLNEKRVDLQLVEARHRVNVTLIPNIHIETPNYTVTRMRHDDLNHSEPLPPSYDMVDVPEEDKLQVPSGQEAVPTRAQPLVRSITPQQPAPSASEPVAATPAVPMSAPQTGDASIIGKIFGWFKRRPEDEQSAPAEAAPSQTPSRPASRGRRDMNRFRAEREPAGEGAREGGRERAPQGGARRGEGQGEARRGRDGGRGRGGEGRGQPREARGGAVDAEGRPQPQRAERPPRGDRPERAERPERGERAERGERPEREGRRERQPRARGEGQRAEREGVAAEPQQIAATDPISSDVQPSLEHQESHEGQNGERAERGEGRSRRRRGRRGGGSRPAEGMVADATNGEAAPPAETGEAAAPTVHEAEPVREPMRDSVREARPEPQQSAQAEPRVETQPAAAAPAHFESEAPPPAAAPYVAPPAAEEVVEQPQSEEPLAAPASEPEREPAPAASPAAPAAPQLKLEWPSDLVQIETDQSKLQAAPPADEGEAPRAPRVRRSPPPVSNEPLVQVETRPAETHAQQ